MTNMPFVAIFGKGGGGRFFAAPSQTVFQQMGGKR
jgi:hypothetical protein